jgi:hypothetical protein
LSNKGDGIKVEVFVPEKKPKKEEEKESQRRTKAC